MKNITYVACRLPYKDSSGFWKVRRNFWLESRVAHDFERMRNEFKRRFKHDFLATDFGRSHEQQEIAYADPRKAGLVARPGTSKHEAGIAIDFAIGQIKAVCNLTQKQVEDFALEFNFIRTVQKEPWHFENRKYWSGDIKEEIKYIS